MVRELQATELRDRMAGGDPPLVLDVREEWEIEAAAFPGAQHLPMDEVAAEVDRLPRDREIVVVCHHGGRSYSVAMVLARAGLNAVNLAGGIDAWSRDVDPAVPTY